MNSKSKKHSASDDDKLLHRLGRKVLFCLPILILIALVAFPIGNVLLVMRHKPDGFVRHSKFNIRVDYSAYGEDFEIIEDIYVYFDEELTQRLRVEQRFDFYFPEYEYSVVSSKAAEGCKMLYITAPTVQYTDASGRECTVVATDLSLWTNLESDGIGIQLVVAPEGHVVGTYRQ